MRVAVFDHQLNHGGGKRFLHNLLAALLKLDDSLQITLFCRIDEKDFEENFKILIAGGVKVEPLRTLQANQEISLSFYKRGINYIGRKVKLFPPPVQVDQQENLRTEIETLSTGFNLAYFPWPFHLKPPNTKCPKVGTFHDFNFKYFFGTSIFTADQLKFLNDSMGKWLQDTTAVVSTHFMKRELKHFYPEAENVHVIHLASLNMYHGNAGNGADFMYKDIMDKPYIVFPVHLTSHKNLGAVIRATHYVNKGGIRFRLVITGKYTETIKGKATQFGLEANAEDNIDVIGLGYIADQQMHYLQQNAFAVMNASFYEAGNGVGLDAWPLGIPVIQSDIPAFEEHLKLQGFEAFTFDPGNDHSIAEAIEDCLTNERKRNLYVQNSLTAYKKLSWSITAEKYLNVFKTLVQKSTHGN